MQIQNTNKAFSFFFSMKLCMLLTIVAIKAEVVLKIKVFLHHVLCGFYSSLGLLLPLLIIPVKETQAMLSSVVKSCFSFFVIQFKECQYYLALVHLREKRLCV